jgi:internalin A
MAVANEAEGWAEAQRRIADCRETRRESLDLSNLRLTRVPEELLELDWLRELDLTNHPLTLSLGIGDQGARALSGLVNLTTLRVFFNLISDEGAHALANLVNLTTLDLGCNQVGTEGAGALSRLVNLAALNLWSSKVGDKGAQALSNLVNLTTLNLRCSEIGDDGLRTLSHLINLTTLDLGINEIGAKGAQALANLVNLTALDLESNRIGDEGAQALSGLVNLTELKLWSNDIGDEGAQALSRLDMLTTLDLGSNRIGAVGAQALSGLGNLTSLNLWSNRIGDEGARALSSLVNLAALDLGSNRIGPEGAQALSGLVNLTTLNLSCTISCISWVGASRIKNESADSNKIGTEGSKRLSSLVNLTTLDLSDNGVIDLSAFRQLDKLRKLDCSRCRVEQAPPALWEMPSLQEVIMYETDLQGVPKEVLSPRQYTSCLESLRAHFKDLEGGRSEISDFKLMLLGNGRVGKTQICRRLQGQEYDETIPSTHGVKICAAPLTALRDPATLRIWDFGGQDIYHGTHALFLKSRAIFLLVWTPESEALHDHDYDGFTFRNQPLGYWLDYVREFGGKDSPVVVVQTQCDTREQEKPLPPEAEKGLGAFPCKDVLRYSAKENRRRAALDEALGEAVQWLREKQGVAVIGKGRAAVKARLEEMYKEGKQLISQDEFLALCEEAGNVSSPPLLLDYLHNIGTVFYREGLFGDKIILDQAWALDAVYAVFHRESKAFRNIERYGGRFRRSDLAEWVWRAHSVAEQELFLSFMRQCGICFTYRRAGEDIEAEYIAPDLLPAREDPAIAEQLRQKWDEGCDAEATLSFELLPPGLMRSLICKVGEQAGLAADYWRDGFYFYDRETGARALVEQRYTEGWAGEIHIRTQRGQAQALLERLLEFVGDRHVAIGARPSGRIVAPDAREDASLPAKEAAITPAPEPSAKTEYYVSYAWGDDSSDEARQRDQFVDRLCAQAEKKGVVIIRDRTEMRYGDRISKFMSRIGRGDLIFIVLSDKYLKSAYCMHELFDVWRNCREDDEEFIRRTRVYKLPCVTIKTDDDRAQYVIYWQEEFNRKRALVEKHGQFVLSDAANDEYRFMTRFANETANILHLVQDILKPQSFDEFVKHGFGDAPPR